jgi:hypothetical protein
MRTWLTKKKAAGTSACRPSVLWYLRDEQRTRGAATAFPFGGPRGLSPELISVHGPFA